MKSISWITYGLIGFLIGAILIALIATGLFALQISNPPPTPTLIPTPTQALQDILDQARQALDVDRDPQRALDILSPHLDEFSDSDELAKALDILARAEMAQGHYQFAAAYLERLVQIAPTADNYIFLARVYDSGGDLKNALEYYLLYLESDDPSITEDIRRLVQERVDQIQATLPSATPSPTP
ncbi:MAG: hypothetical protein QY306_15580 [Anaerolineales bacterium]|nr:MAG: hypothetical protein QY306_15580 [Anaerolineales bacterium]